VLLHVYKRQEYKISWCAHSKEKREVRTMQGNTAALKAMFVVPNFEIE
jgi:hypothetical protein